MFHNQNYYYGQIIGQFYSQFFYFKPPPEVNAVVVIWAPWMARPTLDQHDNKHMYYYCATGILFMAPKLFGWFQLSHFIGDPLIGLTNILLQSTVVACCGGCKKQVGPIAAHGNVRMSTICSLDNLAAWMKLQPLNSPDEINGNSAVQPPFRAHRGREPGSGAVEEEEVV